MPLCHLRLHWLSLSCGPWNISKCDATWGLINVCTLKLVFLECYPFKARHHAIKKLMQIYWQMRGHVERSPRGREAILGMPMPAECPAEGAAGGAEELPNWASQPTESGETEKHGCFKPLNFTGGLLLSGWIIETFWILWKTFHK